MSNAQRARMNECIQGLCALLASSPQTVMDCMKAAHLHPAENMHSCMLDWCSHGKDIDCLSTSATVYGRGERPPCARNTPFDCCAGKLQITVPEGCEVSGTIGAGAGNQISICCYWLPSQPGGTSPFRMDCPRSMNRKTYNCEDEDLNCVAVHELAHMCGNLPESSDPAIQRFAQCIIRKLHCQNASPTGKGGGLCY